MLLFANGTWERKLAADRTGVEAMLAREVPLNRLGSPPGDRRPGGVPGQPAAHPS